MFVKDQIIGVAVELLEAEGGGVAVVNLVHGRGEGLERGEGGGIVHLAVGAEGFDGVGGGFLGTASSAVIVVVASVVEGHFLK